MTAAAAPDCGRSRRALGQEAVRNAARALEEAEQSRTQIRLLSETYPNMTMDDAYAIQAEWMRIKLDAGDAIVGWKIGLTSKTMQSALSIDIPDSGVLLRSMVIPNGSSISADRFIQPRVEAEIAFVMRDGLDGEASPEAILDATDYLAPAIEILDTRIARKDPQTGRLRNVCDTISDNAADGGIVLGEPIHRIRDVDLKWVGAIVWKDGEVEETGLGAGVLGDPPVSVAWLARRLAAYGSRIEPGQIILSGSFIRPVEATPGSHIIADFGQFGRVECRF